MSDGRINQEVNLASKVESLIEIENCVDKICEQYAIEEDNYGNILIAISEAVNNAITHGNNMDPSKKVRLNIAGTSTDLTFVVQDEGIGFDPNSVPDPTLPENLEKLSGRGVFLMRSLADEVEFSDNGTTVILRFSISAN